MGSVSHVRGFVYLLWGEGTHSFKIGFTRERVDVRAATIEAYSPVRIRIVGAINGTPQDEKRFHRSFRTYRSHGEWFVLPEEVVWEVLNWFHVQVDALVCDE